jgi:hypothetical protein
MLLRDVTRWSPRLPVTIFLMGPGTTGESLSGKNGYSIRLRVKCIYIGKRLSLSSYIGHNLPNTQRKSLI